MRAILIVFNKWTWSYNHTNLESRETLLRWENRRRNSRIHGWILKGRYVSLGHYVTNCEPPFWSVRVNLRLRRRCCISVTWQWSCSMDEESTLGKAFHQRCWLDDSRIEGQTTLLYFSVGTNQTTTWQIVEIILSAASVHMSYVCNPYSRFDIRTPYGVDKRDSMALSLVPTVAMVLFFPSLILANISHHSFFTVVFIDGDD